MKTAHADTPDGIRASYPQHCPAHETAKHQAHTLSSESLTRGENELCEARSQLMENNLDSLTRLSLLQNEDGGECEQKIVEYEAKSALLQISIGLS